MAYSLVSASNPKALLAEIVTFATAQGWTIDYNNAAGLSGSVGGQIALHSGNCFIAIGEQSATQNPIDVTGPIDDGRIYMALSTSITVGNVQFWNHPGSIVTTATDVNRLIINDVAGPMTEVHFFGNEDYIICAIRCGALRWTCFGFGNLDMKEMAAPAPGFAFSNFHNFWDTAQTGGAGRYNNVMLGDPNHFFVSHNTPNNTGEGFMLNIPANMLESSFGFDATNHIMGKRGTTRWPLRMCYMTTRVEVGENDNSGHSYLLDHLIQMRAQVTTGGVPLFALPVIYYLDSIGLSSYIGEIPAIRVCRTPNNSPGDILTYGSEEYFIAPWKQFGTLYDSGDTGGNYNSQPNTYDLAWAIRKET